MSANFILILTILSKSAKSNGAAASFMGHVCRDSLSEELDPESLKAQVALHQHW